MHGSFFCLLFLLNYCSSEQLLGGWSTSSDESLKNECLEKALVHLNGAEINNVIRSEASNVVCRTQVVNGLNIKCTFNFRGKKQQCSFYKSFIQNLETQLEQCKEINDEPVIQERDVENTDEKEDDERALLVEEKDDEQEQVVNENNKESEHTEAPDNEEDDEAAIDTLNKKISDQVANNEDEQQQPEQIE